MMNGLESNFGDDEKAHLASGFNEEYENLSDEEVDSINPSASAERRTGVDRSVSGQQTSHVRSQPLVETVGSTEEKTTARASSFSPFDPMGPATFAAQNLPLNALLDESSDHLTSFSSVRACNSTTSGTAGFLEMEEEPSRVSARHADADQVLAEQEDLIDFTPADEPIQTSSGLLLTHRRSSHEKRAERMSYTHNKSSFPASYRPSPTRFEVESLSWGMMNRGGFDRTPVAMLQLRRLWSFAKLWVIFSCVVLFLGSGIMLHIFRQEDAVSSTKKNQSPNTSKLNQMEVPQQILLLPLENAAELARQQREVEKSERQQNHGNGGRRLLSELNDLRVEFEAWIVKHKKEYNSDHEKEYRFSVWRDNHFRTIKKNKRNGNCPLTDKPVFGDNFLKDLTPQEFQMKFLTGYNGPNADGHEIMTGRKRNLQAAYEAPVMHSGLDVTRHSDVHQRLLQKWQMGGFVFDTSRCKWYDASCWMRVVFEKYLYVGTGTMEPKYDSNTYPTSLDWRDFGAVTSVRRQGDCGGCWGVTAVETIESGYFIAAGALVDLSESEVIACTDSCNMCYGGWPQDAYDYVMDHNGIMLADDWYYDADTLLAATEEMASEESQLDSDLFESYRNENCPASGGSGDNSDGHTRFGNIKGYGFATERCVCYSDGSGCACDNQNEGMAVRNLASYGPATVCLDASLWQDYAGGIISASSGCSSEFLAMNHCVQVVGYAYNDGRGGGDEADNQNSRDSGSGSNSHDSGDSKDESNRVGYWIVRNQWSQNWGMNGYAYVAMGENTCGILNDMTQVYF